MGKYDNFVIYARKSKKELNDNAPGINGQIEYIMHKLSTTNLKELNNLTKYKVYIDDGKSGGNWNRPGWLSLMADAKLNHFGYVLVWKQDRIARDLSQFLKFYETMSGMKIKVYHVGITDFEEISLETYDKKFRNVVEQLFAEQVRVATAEKVKNIYRIKKDKAIAKGEKVRWGAIGHINKIDKDILIYNIKEILHNNPMYGYRLIANNLPEFKIDGKPVKLGYQTVRRFMLQNIDKIKIKQ